MKARTIKYNVMDNISMNIKLKATGLFRLRLFLAIVRFAIWLCRPKKVDFEIEKND